MSGRAAIAMSDGEVAVFLHEQRTMTCATLGRDGWPHLMPLWYVLRGEEPWAWTYAKSQKVRNLERDDRCTLQFETGLEYSELRGVMMKCTCLVHRDLETVAALGAEIAARYAGEQMPPAARAAMRGQAAKRVGLQFLVHRVASWDHRKL